MKTQRNIIIVTFLAMSLWIASVAQAQNEPTNLLGVIPDGALIVAHVQVRALLEFERLDQLMTAWGALLGDQTESTIASFRQRYNEELAPFSTNIDNCIIYASELSTRAPVTVCSGQLGEGGYTPPSLAHIEQVDNIMVTGSRRQEIMERVRSGQTAGSSNVGGIEIDSSLLAHLVVVLRPDLVQGVDVPLTTDAVRTIEVRATRDETQLGNLALEIRVNTNSAETAQQLQVFLLSLLQNFGQEAVNQNPELAGFIEEIPSWSSLDGSTIVLRPRTEVIASLSALAIPMMSSMRIVQ